MSRRSILLKSLVKIIDDYRAGEIDNITPDLISKWLTQFSKSNQDRILEELIFTISKTYISKALFREFLKVLAKSKKIASGSKISGYWRKANFLDIQTTSNSQKEILLLFNEVLHDTYGFYLEDTGSEEGDYIYIDDCMGTGTRIKNDICTWLNNDSPKEINLHIITPIMYTGSWWIDDHIKTTAENNGKIINMHKWRLPDYEMENRREKRNISDVLWPSEIPNDQYVLKYKDYLDRSKYSPILRKPGNPGVSRIYKNDEAKKLLEAEFLIRGCQIRDECTSLPEKARPLGFQNLICFGFGSMFITYRNCPNNCPLVFWVEQNDYPSLFPRKTNNPINYLTFKKGFLD